MIGAFADHSTFTFLKAFHTGNLLSELNNMCTISSCGEHAVSFSGETMLDHV